MCKYTRNISSTKISIPSSKAAEKSPGVFLRMPRAERLKLKRNRAPDKVSYEVQSQLVRTQILNQCAHLCRVPTVKIRGKALLADSRASAQKQKRIRNRQTPKK